MNPVDELIREFELPGDHGPADAVAAAAARRRLRQAMAPAPSGRRWVRVGVVLGLAAALLLGAAALAGRDTVTSAGAALEEVAKVAERAPASTVPTAHQYLYLKWMEGATTISGMGAYDFAYTEADLEEDWEAPDGSGRQRIIPTSLSFLTPADRVAWQRSGMTSPAMPRTDGRYPRGAYFDNCDVDPQGPAGLPLAPSALLRALVRHYEGGHYDLQGTFHTVGCMLQASAYPPLRAALYRMLARLPGVSLLGLHRDRIGRSGLAVAVTDPRAHIRGELVFDPRSSEALEVDYVQLAPSIGEPRQLPNGTVLNYVVFLDRAVVDSTTATHPRGRSDARRPHRPTRA